MNKSDANYMSLAVKEARKNIRTMHGGPFGACIVKEGRVLALARNTVLKMDASCHAEINAIRAASRKLKTFDLSGCRIYSTCEPCPMCFSAIHWARIDKVIYASTLKDAVKTGFNELKIKARLIKSMGKSGVVLKRMRDFKECRKLFNDWDNSARKRFY